MRRPVRLNDAVDRISIDAVAGWDAQNYLEKVGPVGRFDNFRFHARVNFDMARQRPACSSPSIQLRGLGDQRSPFLRRPFFVQGERNPTGQDVEKKGRRRVGDPGTNQNDRRSARSASTWLQRRPGTAPETHPLDKWAEDNGDTDLRPEARRTPDRKPARADRRSWMDERAAASWKSANRRLPVRRRRRARTAGPRRPERVG